MGGFRKPLGRFRLGSLKHAVFSEGDSKEGRVREGGFRKKTLRLGGFGIGLI